LYQSVIIELFQGVLGSAHDLDLSYYPDFYALSDLGFSL